MGTDWVCFVCNSHNDINSRNCSSCGAKRPTAVKAFSQSAESDSAFNKSGSMTGLDDRIIMDNLEALVTRAINDGCEVEQFNVHIGEIFDGIDAAFARLNEDIARVDDELIVKQLKIKYADARYMYKLALMYLQMYDPNDVQPVRVGLLLAKQAHVGLRFLSDYLRDQQSSELMESQNLLGRAMADLLHGEIDADTYFDLICQADDTLHDLLNDAHENYFAGLEEARAFDGKDTGILISAGDKIEKATNLWSKAILAVRCEDEELLH
ncbi:hypothetical protein IJT10_05010 [bacterium]|nr:hypothetical protein [bacterium]